MVKSPKFSFKGFDWRILLSKNWEKLDTYAKILLSLGLAYVISDEIVLQGVVAITSKFLLDILHFYIFEVTQNGKGSSVYKRL